MEQITITLPDGAKKEVKKGTTPLDIASDISERLAAVVMAATFNGTVIDATRPLEEDGTLVLLKFETEEGKEVFRHSSAHLLAQAVLELFPESKLTIGPVVEEGFYYDIDHPPFQQEDLEKIEAQMDEIAKRGLQIERKVLSKQEALDIFKDNPYKVELISEMPDDETITAYQQGEFIDLCRGPHLPNTKLIKAVKLTKLAGAYWRGDAKNKQLQRIYGISFPDKKQLKKYEELMVEVEKRDHRKLGQKLGLFMFHEWSPGSPFLLPKGTIVYNTLLEFIRSEYIKRGYNEVVTPQLFNKALWEASGHWQHYKENMFLLNVDNEEFSLKPMNCPSHVLIFKSETRSYRDLPFKIADFCMLHRNELKGVLGGMTRVRKFSQDDAHVFCTSEQLNEEIKQELEFMKYVYSDVFKFEFTANLSTKPEKAMGDPSLWENAERSLKDALESEGINYRIKEGDGAFYGPKIDIEVNDALGRMWQLATIQLDFQMPLRMDATYEGQDGKKHHAIMIHRAILGSLERFLGVLTEHCAGRFPMWLSPLQVKILTLADRHNDYAKKAGEQMKAAGLRVEYDFRSETIGKKVRDAQLEQANYILVIGDKDVEANVVTVRTREGEVTGQKNVAEFIAELQKEVETKQ